MTRIGGLIVLACLTASPLARAADAPVDVAKLPVVRELPDPFKFEDGKRVQNADDWKRRRDEIRKLVLQYEYGTLPDDPGPVKVTESAPASTIEGGATVHELSLSVGPHGEVSVPLILTVPPGKGPFPAIIEGDLTWGRIKPEIAAKVISRGYLLAQFDRTKVAPDANDRTTGVYPLHPDRTWGALAAWAWGFGRVTDYLVMRPDVDRSKLIVTGHSRGGKAALLAGAIDERIALTVPNGSGCGGAGCFRIQWPMTEDLKAITRNFPFWFAPDFSRFVGAVDQLPFDQHEVKALIAPRALLTTDSLDDLWANPLGTEVSFLASREVFDFLGAADKTGMHFRHGPHAHDAEDWTALLDFADTRVLGKPGDRRFDELPFPQIPPAFTWKAPAH